MGNIYLITPVAKPRMVNSDRWKNPRRPAVQKYFDFAEQVRAHKVHLPEDGAHVIFYIAMPPSWSKKKKEKMIGSPHKQTPDLDNLLKALGDAVYGNDAVISDVRATKIWGYRGGIQIFDRICFV